MAAKTRQNQTSRRERQVAILQVAIVATRCRAALVSRLPDVHRNILEVERDLRVSSVKAPAVWLPDGQR
jgi:hypothetical protein